ncbi:hypothetical protein C0Q70_02482 [Pomacea canaliculata]|uniref:Uncharacterized protein n=1 Tax=Pomacea canaliculata TaxID=400727 RepID=A0A2T7PQ18_POMCA|nr:hypothetical protein C0Q70_02482 [Pomacea canaliculata]
MPTGENVVCLMGVQIKHNFYQPPKNKRRRRRSHLTPRVVEVRGTGEDEVHRVVTRRLRRRREDNSSCLSADILQATRWRCGQTASLDTQMRDRQLVESLMFLGACRLGS